MEQKKEIMKKLEKKQKEAKKKKIKIMKMKCKKTMEITMIKDIMEKR